LLADGQSTGSAFGEAATSAHAKSLLIQYYLRLWCVELIIWPSRD
jgi:hypothetical protein